jgi:hypothetical protein
MMEMDWISFIIFLLSLLAYVVLDLFNKPTGIFWGKTVEKTAG